jgi:hypothetical protein
MPAAVAPLPLAVLRGRTTSSFIGTSCADDAESSPTTWLDFKQRNLKIEVSRHGC